MKLVTPFEYRGCQFVCSVVEQDLHVFEPHVLYQTGIQDLKQIALPRDSDAYDSAAEAMRHAQQQAIRWVHDHTGDGQGQF